MSRYPQTILATCCVPWHEDGQVDEEIFRASIRTLIEQGLGDLYVFGTAGEGYAVNEQQFDDVMWIFVDELRGDGLPPMVGMISLTRPHLVNGSSSPRSFVAICRYIRGQWVRDTSDGRPRKCSRGDACARVSHWLASSGVEEVRPRAAQPRSRQDCGGFRGPARAPFVRRFSSCSHVDLHWAGNHAHREAFGSDCLGGPGPRAGRGGSRSQRA